MRIESSSVSHSGKWENSFWNFYSHLVEYNCVGTFLYFLLLAVETLQVLHFPLAYAEYGADLSVCLGDVLKAFLCAPLIVSNRFAFAFFWAFQYFVLVLTLGLIYFLLLYYKDTTGKPSFAGKLMYKTCGLLIIVYKKLFFMPSLYSFLASVFCLTANVCWRGPYLLTSMLSILGLALVLSFVLVTEFFVDGYVKSALPWAGLNVFFGWGQQAMKTFLAFCLVIGIDDEKGSYLHAVMTVGFFAAGYVNYSGPQFYAEVVNVFEFTRTFFFAFFCFGVCSAKSIRKELVLEANVFVALASLLGSVLLYRYQQIWLYYKAENDILRLHDEVDIINSVYYLGKLNKTIGREEDLILVFTGMLAIHKSVCGDPECTCESLENSLKLSSQEKEGKAIERSVVTTHRSILVESSSVTDRIFTGNSIVKLWKKFVVILVDSLSKKHSKSVSICILTAYYQEIMSKNYYKSYFNLIKASDHALSYYHKFQIYHMIRLLDSLLAKTNRSRKGIEIDVGLLQHFEESRKTFEVAMQRCTRKVLQFWRLLLLAKPKVELMYTIGGEVLADVEQVRTAFDYLVTMFPDHIRSYAVFASFLRNVVNSEMEAAEYHEKATQLRRSVELMQKEDFLDEGMFSVNREIAIIIASGDINKLGVILAINEHVHKVFGYKESEIVGLTVNKLMPRVIAARHYEYMMRFAMTGVGKFIGTENFSFGLCKNGLLVPLVIVTAIMPGLNSGLKYIAFLRKDLGFIKKTFLKFPYKYGKDSDACFIITTRGGKIIGTTEKTAKLFKIPMEYFEKKEKLFDKAVKIQQLQPSLLKKEKELLKGTTVTLYIRPLYDMLDPDFFTEQEQKELYSNPASLEVFMKLLKHEHSLDVKYNVYAFTPAAAKAQQAASEEQANTVAELERSASFASGSSEPAGKVGKLLRVVKKSLHEQHKSGSVAVLRNMIAVALLVYMVIDMIDFISFSIALGKIENALKLSRHSHQRRNLLVTMLEGFQSYISLSLGREPNTTAFVSNREGHLRGWESKVMEEAKDNEYSFLTYLARAKLEEANQLAVAPGAHINMIFINGEVMSDVEGLTGAVIQISSAVFRMIMNEDISSFNTEFIRTIYERVPTINNPLNQIEKDTFLILRNGLYNTINASTAVIDCVERFKQYRTDRATLVSFRLNLCRLIVMSLLLIVSFPFTKRVERSKRRALRLFAEISKCKITEMIKNCEKFSAHQGKLRETGEKLVAENQGSTADNSNIERMGKHKRKDSPKSTKAQEEAENHSEDRFKRERRKAFDKYRTKISTVYLLLLFLVLFIMGIQLAVYFSIYFWKRKMEANKKFLHSLQSKWFYLAGALDYLMATTKTYYIDLGAGSEFLRLMQESLDAEDRMNAMITSHPSNQERVAKYVHQLMQPNYCSQLYPMTVSGSRGDVGWCSRICNGVLNNGLKSAIYYLIVDFKQMYSYLMLGKDIDYSLLAEDKLLFETILVPSYKFLIEMANKSELEVVNEIRAIMISLFTVMIIATLTGSVLLQKFFIDKLNEELWKAKGIILLLPHGLMAENSLAKSFFNRQLSVIL